ncbi:exodeoxyribonuclease VII large subunit [Rhodoligotrophos appendicifer]|uniref:exodeoxyribonuclease VII large subunit n=1 Tax=Rhodoligotrophos appendicifer TaxID=987056 RepID=UPI0011849A41|nr:exodeoxyribonuclease VII large subunit [Rhodoligotrophos appendicifer]
MPKELPANGWPLDPSQRGGTANVVEFSVSELSFALKRTVEDAFAFVRVRGEISGFRGQHSSGHCYFALKDDAAKLEAVIWRTAVAKLRFKPQEGLEVIATGKLTTFPGSSKYQIVIEQLEPAGIGALMALLDERRRKLTAEGLFATERKVAIPFLPRVIGVVTSPTGAVIRDILHRLSDRFPRHVLVWPVRVQGETCAAEVAAAIRGFNALPAGGPVPRPDVIIVARGGGSLEDLWGFNEEDVVRAAAGSDIPLISAVGHETDTTLIDHAADRRCPTPTAAAECAVPVRADLIATVDDLGYRQRRAARRMVEERRVRVLSAARGLPKPEDMLGLARQKFDTAAGRLTSALRANTHHHRASFIMSAAKLQPRLMLVRCARDGQRLDAQGHRLGRALGTNLRHHRAEYARIEARLSPRSTRALANQGRERLNACSVQSRRAIIRRLESLGQQLQSQGKLFASLGYKAVLERGYALVLKGGHPVRSAAETEPGEAVSLRFHDGESGAVITSGVGLAGPRRINRGRAAAKSQGELF